MRALSIPAQKKSFRSKGKEWRDDTINSIDKAISYHNNDNVRRSIREKFIDSNLYDGVIDMDDMMKTVNSSGIIKSFNMKNVQHRPIMRPKIELLVGEATKMPFAWSVMVTDPASISKKQENRKEAINKRLMEIIQSDTSEEEMEKALKEASLYFKYSWKDLKEVRSTKVLKYYEQKLKLTDIFHENIIDKFVLGEEITMFDIIGKEVVAFKLDPKKVQCMFSGDSNSIADADVIVIEEYWSVGKIIDNYYDWLTPSEIDELNEGTTGDTMDEGFRQTIDVASNGVLLDSMISATESVSANKLFNKTLIDSEGNYRIMRCMWRSQKLVLEVSGTDPDTGDPYTKIMSEEYIVNPLLGESAKKLWVEEWWEGTKIGGDLNKRVRPRLVQFNGIGNPSKGHPGVVGRFNSTSGGKVVSFISKMKPYQYLYDAVWERLLDAIKKDLGNIIEMDMAKKPAGWTTDKWLHYAYKGGIMFVDSFKEATKGASTGKLAGTFNTTGKTVSTSNGNYIQQHVNLLEYIKKELGDVVGITPQREGAVAASASVGTTERSVMASNNNTAYEFYTHEQFKLECMQVLLETAKVALRGNKQLMQLILDDFSIEMFDIDGDEFIDSDYAVFLTTSAKATDAQNKLEMYAQAFMQNGGSFSTVMDITFSDSVAEKRTKIEVADAELKQERAAAGEQQQKAQQEALQAEMEAKQEEMDLKKYEIDEDNRTKIIIAEMSMNKDFKRVDADTISKEDIEATKRDKIRSDEKIAATKNNTTV